MCLSGPAIGQGPGISGQPWAPRIRQCAGHEATLGLPLMGACFPGRALGALCNGAVPWGSWGPQRPWEAIFIPGAQGRDSITVELLAL